MLPGDTDSFREKTLNANRATQVPRKAVGARQEKRVKMFLHQPLSVATNGDPLKLAQEKRPKGPMGSSSGVGASCEEKHTLSLLLPLPFCTPCTVAPVLGFSWRSALSHPFTCALFMPAPPLSAMRQFFQLCLLSKLLQCPSQSFQARPQTSQSTIPYYYSFQELKILPVT